MSPAMVAGVLAAVLGSSVIAAIITGLFSKKRMGAEAAEIITKAASGVVVSIEAELARQRATNQALLTEHAAAMTAQQALHQKQMQDLADSHAEEIEEWRKVLQLHVAWDHIAIAKLAEIGIDLPEAPPLRPARSFDHPGPQPE